MNKKVVSSILSILVIGTLVVLMVKDKVSKPEPLDDYDVAAETVAEEQENMAPDFILSQLDGSPLRLSELKGKKVILNFWASYCPPCKAEMPHMQNYYDTYKEEDNVEIVAVNLTTSERHGIKSVQDFVDAYKLTFPIPLDENGQVGQLYQIRAIPTTYLLNTDGTLAYEIVGPMDEKSIRNYVDMLD